MAHFFLKKNGALNFGLHAVATTKTVSSIYVFQGKISQIFGILHRQAKIKRTLLF